MSPRRILALVALVALVALHLSTELLSFPFRNRERLHALYAAKADGNAAEYAQFLEGVRAHTKPGDRIAVMVTPMRWNAGYSYAYYRGSYLLAGREVIPLIYENETPIPSNLERAGYVAAWHAPAPPGRVVWEGSGGVLLSRR
jgi:uncharacterized membrane protein